MGISRTGAGWSRTTLAVVLAYVLALHTLLVALGGALHAPSFAGGIQGSICAPSGDAQIPDESPAQTHAKLCCIAGCNAPSLSAGPPFIRIAWPAIVAVVAVQIRDPAPHTLSVLHHSFGPRAPPRLG
jgi:hypothetical protein